MFSGGKAARFFLIMIAAVFVHPSFAVENKNLWATLTPSAEGCQESLSIKTTSMVVQKALSLPVDMLLGERENVLEGLEELAQIEVERFGDQRKHLGPREEARSQGFDQYGTLWAERAQKLLNEEVTASLDIPLLQIYATFLARDLNRSAFDHQFDALDLNRKVLRLKLYLFDGALDSREVQDFESIRKNLGELRAAVDLAEVEFKASEKHLEDQIKILAQIAKQHPYLKRAIYSIAGALLPFNHR